MKILNKILYTLFMNVTIFLGGFSIHIKKDIIHLNKKKYQVLNFLTTSYQMSEKTKILFQEILRV